MPVTYENLFTSFGDFTAVSPGGSAIVDVNSGQMRIKSQAGVGAGINTLGAYQSSNIQTGASGHTIFVKWRVDQSAANRDCWIQLSNAASISTAAHPGVDFQNGGSYLWDGNSSPGVDQFTWAINTDYYVKALVNANGTITFSISTTINGSYTTIGSSVVADSFNAVGAGLRLVAQIVDQAGNAPTMNVDNYYYTDDGDLTSQVPTGLSATAQANGTSILLTYTDNGTATSETGIKIERSVDGITYTQIDTVAQGVGQYLSSGLDLGVSYSYKIRSYKTAGGVDFNSAYTSVVSATTNGAPTADAGTDDTVNITDGVDLNGSATDDGYPLTTKDSSDCSALTAWTKRENSGAFAIDSGRFKFSPANGVSNGDLATYRTAQTTMEDGDVVSGKFQVGADNNDTLYISLTNEARGPLNSTENRVTIAIGGGGGILGQRSLAGSSETLGTTPARNADPATIYLFKFTNDEFGRTTIFVKESTAVNYTELGQFNSDFDFNVPLYFNVLGYRDASQTGLYFDDFLWAGLGSLTYQWTKQSGPGSVTFDDDTDPTTHADFSAPGTYVLRLTASDGAASDTDDVTIIVQSVGGGDGGTASGSFLLLMGDI